MDFKIFTLEITGKRTGTKPRKRRALRRFVIRLHQGVKKLPSSVKMNTRKVNLQ
jgi:hypothetical protein